MHTQADTHTQVLCLSLYPRFVARRAQVPKLYEAQLSSDLPADAVATFARGSIVLDGAPCAPAELRPTGPRAAEVTLTEGRYHQVKRMFASQARPSRSGTCGIFCVCRALFIGAYVCIALRLFFVPTRAVW
jgi:hypothetical protein